MHRVLYGLLSGLLLLFVASQQSYAEQGALKDNAAMGFQEGHISLIPSMIIHGIEGREGLPEAESHLWRYFVGLGLDDKQKETLKEVKSRVIKNAVRKRAELEVERIELMDVLEKDPVDMSAVEGKLKKMESLLTAIRLSHIKAIEEVKAILTSEQRKKFKGALEMSPLGRMFPGGMGVSPPCEEDAARRQEKAYSHHER